MRAASAFRYWVACSPIWIRKKTLRKTIADAKVEARAELALEREIDAVGHGFVAWADVEALRPLLSAAAAEPFAQALLEQTKRVVSIGAAEIRAAAPMTRLLRARSPRRAYSRIKLSGTFAPIGSKKKS